MDPFMRKVYDEKKDDILLIKDFIKFCVDHRSWSVDDTDLLRSLSDYTGVDLVAYEEELEAEEAASRVQDLLNSLKEQ